MWGRKKGVPERANDGEAAAGLRQLVLSTSPTDMGLTAGDDPDRVHGVLLETGYGETTVTIVSLIDGTTSMYFSTGGGTIGAGQHEVVAEASRAFVAMAQVLVGQLEPTSDFPLPADGRVRFQVLTRGGGRTAEADEQELGEGRHALSPLFHAGQDVITQIRLLQESQQS